MIEWKESYNIHTANIAGVIKLVVSWTKDGYKVSVNCASSFQLKNTYDGLEKAKQEAIKLGKRVLTKAFEVLK